MIKNSIFKKRFCVLWVLTLCLQMVVVLAAGAVAAGTGTECIANGDFTELTEAQFFKGFSRNLGESAVETETVYSAPYALKLGYTEPKDGETRIASRVTTLINGIEAGATCVFSAYVRVDACMAYMSVSCYDSNKTYLDSINSPIIADTNGAWQKMECTFSTPPGCTRLYVYLRSQNAGYAYYDDVSMRVTQSLIYNGDFTVLSGEFFDGFSKNRGISAMEAEKVCSPPYALKLGYLEKQAGETVIDSRVTANVLDVQPGAKYRFSAHVMADTCSAHMSVSCYDADKTYLQGFVGTNVTGTDGVWADMVYEFYAPMGCSKFYIYLCAQNAGYAYFDDVRLDIIEMPPRLTLELDPFLYSEQRNCSFAVIPNTDVYDFIGDETVQVAVFEGETKMAELNNIPLAEAASGTLPMSAFPKEETPYTVRVITDDEIAAEETVYKYKRPKSMDAEGNIRISGTPFVPMMGYHVYRNTMVRAAKATGVNLVQSAGATADDLWDYLEMAREEGVMVLASLYSVNSADPDRKLRPAAHPLNETRSREVVQRICKHPNLFGYIVMDEPFTQGTDSFDTTAGYLKDSYKLIREEESKEGADFHPILIQESSSGSYYESSKYCDVLIMHTYPVYPGNEQGTYLAYEQVKRALESTKDTAIRRRPVYYLGQTFGRDSAEDPGTNFVLPTINEVREMLTYAARAGAKGLGYFCFHDGQNGYLSNRPLYPELVEFAVEGLPAIINRYITKPRPYVLDENEELMTTLSPGGLYTAVFDVPSACAAGNICVVAQYRQDQKELISFAVSPMSDADATMIPFTVASGAGAQEVRAFIWNGIGLHSACDAVCLPIQH